MITGAADEIVQARALAAQHDDEVAGEVEAVVVGFAALVEPDDPQVLALEFFERADQVDDAGDAQMLGRAGAGFYGNGAQRRGTTLGEDNTVHARAIRHAQQRAEILRIFHAVESQDETRGGGLSGRRREEIFERKKLLRVDERDNALMRGGFGGDGELLAGLLENADASLAALGDQLLEARVMPLAGHEHVVKAPLAGFEGLFHRVQAVENFHGFSLRRGRGPRFHDLDGTCSLAVSESHTTASTKRRIPANAPSGVAASQESDGSCSQSPTCSPSSGDQITRQVYFLAFMSWSVRQVCKLTNKVAIAERY